MQLTPHFSLRELCVTTHRAWMEANLDHGAYHLGDLTELALLLERVRTLCGDQPVVVHSGYRCPGLNAEVGGSVTSQHMQGQAADFHVIGLSLEAVWGLIRCSGLPFGQLILEGWVTGAPTWIHLSTVGQRSADRCGEVMTWSQAEGYHLVERV